MRKVLFSLFAFAASVFSVNADGHLRGTKMVKLDSDYAHCDLHDLTEADCRANPVCTWCVSAGVIDIQPTCMSVLESPWVPRQIFACEQKTFPPVVEDSLDVAINEVEHALITHPHWLDFLNFIERFNKRYDDKDFVSRFGVFIENLRKIKNHEFDFDLDINQFADMTEEEFRVFISSGYLKPETSLFHSGRVSCSAFSSNTSSLPSSVDWRTQGAVTPVKDQGQCGSCWSFSATGAMEGAWKIAKGSLVSLSEQQLVDCSGPYGNMACNGGLMDDAFAYAVDHGMCTEASDPYLARKGICSNCSPVASFRGCVDVTPNNQLHLKEAISRGPVSVAIEADTSVFQFYSGGIMNSAKCGTNLDHGVLAVGYGTENGQGYWIVKNSWGPSWGDNGYIRLAANFGSSNDEGICGIAMQPSYPVV